MYAVQPNLLGTCSWTWLCLYKLRPCRTVTNWAAGLPPWIRYASPPNLLWCVSGKTSYQHIDVGHSSWKTHGPWPVVIPSVSHWWQTLYETQWKRHTVAAELSPSWHVTRSQNDTWNVSRPACIHYPDHWIPRRCTAPSPYERSGYGYAIFYTNFESLYIYKASCTWWNAYWCYARTYTCPSPAVVSQVQSTSSWPVPCQKVAAKFGFPEFK